jgi:hypothetical protein
MRFLGGEGPAVTFVAFSREEAMSVGEDQIEALLEKGWRPCWRSSKMTSVAHRK